ncbi:MAG: ComF family protein [Patescibacteria group bacterium]
MNYIQEILNFVFPIKCILCGRKDFNLCIQCLTNAPENQKEVPSWIFPVLDYQYPPIKKGIWLLKYSHKKDLSFVFAKILYSKILEELSERKIMENFCKPILIPIPLSKERFQERGFNQAELICQELIKIDNNQNYELKNNILIKIKNTPQQVNLKNRKERLKNLAGCFVIENKNMVEIKNRNIILIDDVTTTGATLKEAKKILKKSGAKNIIAFTIAH